MPSTTDIEAAFREFVSDPAFPCLGAKSTLHDGRCDLHVYGSLADSTSSPALAAALGRFAAGGVRERGGFSTFIAVFPDEPASDEIQFERQLWSRLQSLHECDVEGEWDPLVSDDPEDPHFAFSVAGQAFFVVGLHPAGSRMARRFRWPALAFNPHAQFTRLRAEGRYMKLRDAIRDRELALQGILNPNLADFGERSDARQYSGRAVGDEWRCPFHRTK